MWARQSPQKVPSGTQHYLCVPHRSLTKWILSYPTFARKESRTSEGQGTVPESHGRLSPGDNVLEELGLLPRDRYLPGVVWIMFLWMNDQLSIKCLSRGRLPECLRPWVLGLPVAVWGFEKESRSWNQKFGI